MPEERLLIKLILPKQGKEKPNQPGGGKSKPLKPVTANLRRRLLAEVDTIRAEMEQSRPYKPTVAPARVVLEDKALAKSHVPRKLFKDETCPIIGVGRPCELFVQVTRRGLEQVKRLVETDSDPIKKDLSTIANICPITPEDRLHGASAADIFDQSPPSKRQSGHRQVKVHLFNYTGSAADEGSSQFRGYFEELGISGYRINERVCSNTYILECKNADQVSALADALMVRSIGPVPVLRLNPRNVAVERPFPDNLPSPGTDASRFPIVGVVDSGINDSHPSVKAWLYASERFVAKEEENTKHGTFVAGLVLWGESLNPDIPELEPLPCRILDVQILPNHDPDHGDVGTITEIEFLESLQKALHKHANEVKVWNLSLGTDTLCETHRFSDLAVALDNLQDQFEVTFVVAAGNFTGRRLLSANRDEKAKESGRITAPADSVLAITVGSIAHLDLPSGVQRGEVSPFSRNGPGPNYIIKPDLSHFGGNIGISGGHPVGVTSIGVDSNLTDDLGTSFATPLVSRQLAHIFHTVTPSPSPSLARALLTHNARDVRHGGRVSDGDDHLIGFGTPLKVRNALECSRDSCTLVFQEQLRPGYFLEWDDFPYPPCLIQGGKYFGEITMTLAYPPARNMDFGSEYCETHVEVSFGTFKKHSPTSITKKPKSGYNWTPQVPLEHKNPGLLWESFQVEKLRKWAPVRTYHRLIDKGIVGDRWRLFVRMTTRHDLEKRGQPVQQPFVLIVTIGDPRGHADVYNDMTRHLQNKFQIQNLVLRQTIRVQQ